MKADGSVVTWGSPHYGGDSTSVQEQLQKVERIYSTGLAFAALTVDGSVVTWGANHFGADSGAVQDQLTNVHHI